MNGAGNAEYDDPRAFCFAATLQAAGAIIVQIGNDHHLSAAAPGNYLPNPSAPGKAEAVLIKELSHVSLPRD